MKNTPTEEEVKAISEALSHGNTMEAIKLYRISTGKGLKDAKVFIESLSSTLHPNEAPTRTQQSTPIGVIILLFLITLVGGIALAFASVRAMSLGKQSVEWPSTQGTITLVRGEQSGHRKTPPRIEFSYVVDDQKYNSDTYTYQHHSSRAIPTARYHRGQDVTVYYDPSNPKNAVLLPGFKPHLLRPFIGLVGLMLSIYIAKRGIREHKQKIANNAPEPYSKS